MLKIWKKSWEPFRICLLNSTANPAQFGWKWAGLALLSSRQLLNGSHNFFHTFSIIFNYLFKYETIETHARAFSDLIFQLWAVWLTYFHNKIPRVWLHCLRLYKSNEHCVAENSLTLTTKRSTIWFCRENTAFSLASWQ